MPTQDQTQPAKKARKKLVMTPEHKSAMMEGRDETLAIRLYLNRLGSDNHADVRERLTRKLASVNEQLADESLTPLRRVNLLQARLDLQRQLRVNGPLSPKAAKRMEEAEAGFIERAKAYSQRKGISRTAWRQLGVDPKVLDAAGIR